MNDELARLQQFLSGRIWPAEKLPFDESVIAKAREQQLTDDVQAIEFLKGKPSCRRCRCTSSDTYIRYYCAKCDKICVYCRNCIQMGRLASCDTLVRWIGATATVDVKPKLQWQGQFTAAQARVSQELIDSVRAKRSHLVHAVCGAGKTEILFAAIEVALSLNWRVCVATPRTDVVLELAPRFQQVFPDVNIQALYGGATLDMSYSPFIIATTHQLFRFENAFDIIFVDEADAFPYTFDVALQQAVVKARKQDGVTMLVTATPSINMQAQFQKTGAYSFIPRRFHGADLPVPRFSSLWFYDKQLQMNRLPKKIACWIKNCEDKGQPYLLFFPTIALMKQAAHLFSVPAVYAEDAERKEKVLALRNGEVAGLLTTTILERGITIPRVQVAVIGAESAIFTASALIQISGRVGRAQHEPTGDIVFFHHGVTREMDAARREILRLNAEVN